MYCESCGTNNPVTSKYCICCGAKLESHKAEKETAVSTDPGPVTQPELQSQPVQIPVGATPQQITRSAPQPAVRTRKPEKVTPLPVWKFIGMFLLSGIPILGLVMLFVWGFGKSFNRNTRNLARAELIMILIVIVLTAAGYFTIWSSLQSVIPGLGTDLN